MPEVKGVRSCKRDQLLLKHYVILMLRIAVIYTKGRSSTEL